MDRNTIIGLVLIAGILFMFSIFTAEGPTNKDKGDDNQEEVVIDDERDSTEAIASNLIPILGADSLQIVDSIKGHAFRDTVSDRDTFIFIAAADNSTLRAPEVEKIGNGPKCEEQILTIQNDKLRIDITNQGGYICGVYLKEYQTYWDWMDKKDKNIAPLQLLDHKSKFGVEFFLDGKRKNTLAYCFKLVEVTKTSAKFEMTKNGRKIAFTYKLNKGKYDVDFGISINGFDERDLDEMALTCDIRPLSTEKHLETERTVSTIFFKYHEDGYDYLSIAGDDELVLEQKTDWIAYKQSYFSAVLMNKEGFEPIKGANLEVIDPAEDDTTYVKRYRSKVGLGLTTAAEPVALSWYFGPNDYDELATYDIGAEDVVDLGWGLFRWINVYAMRPVFNFFMSWGIGAGLAILLLTIIVKAILSPVNLKMYKSSAKMKILKPEIDKISKKFPKKEDAMKKQQEVMALYRETGVSPLAGCIPMLIQMPILFAIFRLFPSSIEIRQKGFLWAEDLSTYDSVLDFGFYIPLYGDHISLFTLLMAGTTLAYTHYTSQNITQPTAEGMPNMKVIMYIFPFLMIFFFNNFSSGLSYYYFISTLITMIIMWAIKRFVVDEAKLAAQIAENRENPVKKKKSKFMQRLEDAQKLQQEKMKNKKK